MNQKGNIMILTQEQQLVSNDLLNFIKLKNLKIESPEDLKDAFRDDKRFSFSLVFSKSRRSSKETIYKRNCKTSGINPAFLGENH